ncbi:MAG: S41 family peptidase [Polaribacter sp.]
MKKVFLLIFLTSFIGCNPNKKYVEDVLDIIENNSFRKDSINWKLFRDNLINEVKKDDEIDVVHNLISKALYDLGDNHSFLLTKEMESKIYNDRNPIPNVYADTILGKIGYVKIPQFLGNDRQVNQFALNIQDRIKWIDSFDLNFWIIDLRGNSGGNMFPMYLGLAPILGDNISGYFKKSDNKLEPWYFKNNSVFIGEKKMLEIESSYKLKSKIKKVAILIDNDTGSSGEAIAIAFKGFSNSRFFGFPTYGVSTGNEVFELKNGTKLVLTTSIFMDRNKNLYGGKVKPDIISYQPKKEATEWLLKTNTNK